MKHKIITNHYEMPSCIIYEISKRGGGGGDTTHRQLWFDHPNRIY